MGSTISIGRVIVGLVVIWLIVIVLMTGPLFYTGDTNADQIAKQLNRAMSHLEILKKQNEEFRAILSDVRQFGNDALPCNDQLYQQLQSKLVSASDLLTNEQKQHNEASSQSPTDNSRNSGNS